MEKSWEIIELKIKYTDNTKINITDFSLKIKNAFEWIKININEISINNIIASEDEDPTNIEAGIKEKRMRK